MDYIHHYKSPLGDITLASNGQLLTGLWFDWQKYFASTLDKNFQEKDFPIFELTDKWLNIYFSGKKPNFMPPILMNTTPFREAVWKVILSIPYGKTMTYGEIAARIAKQKGLKRMSAQAVGNAVAHNPILLIIPCHRVVGKNDCLTGYAGGIDKKIKLLELEKIDLSKFSITSSNQQLGRL